MVIKEALFYKKVKSGEVQCLLCPHFCVIPENQSGKCRVRKNLEGTLFSLNYGRHTSSNLDPIEKKPLYHFYPGSKILSLGTLGCNLSCSFCQNWSISQAPETPGDEAKINSLTESSTPEEVAEVALKLKGHRNIGVAYTYNEPGIWYEFVLESAKKVREAGMLNVMVTNGFINPQPLKELVPYLGAANVDLKSIREDFYRQNCGAKLAPVLEALKIYKENLLLEVTNLLIPGLNDSPQEITELVDWVVRNLGRDTPLHFSRYHPDYRSSAPHTGVDILEKAHQIAAKKLYYVYVGNLEHNPWDSTYCPGCHQKVLERSGMKLLKSDLSGENACRSCGVPIKIVGSVTR